MHSPTACQCGSPKSTNLLFCMTCWKALPFKYQKEIMESYAQFKEGAGCNGGVVPRVMAEKHRKVVMNAMDYLVRLQTVTK